MRSKALIKVMGAFSVAFFGAGALLLIVRSLSRRPIVMMSDSGIRSREPLYPLPLVEWDEILGVTVHGTEPLRQLRFDLQDPHAVVSRCRSRPGRAFHSMTLRQGGSILNVSEAHTAYSFHLAAELARAGGAADRSG